LNGTKITVDVPTHVAGVMDFANGAVGTITTSFDVWSSAPHPPIEIYGTEGSMQVPDPNGFGGPVRVRKAGDKEWSEVELTHGFAQNSRGIGVADMAYAIQSGRKHRASGDLGYHVLEAMHGFHDASEASVHYTMKSDVERPAALPTGLPRTPWTSSRSFRSGSERRRPGPATTWSRGRGVCVSSRRHTFGARRPVDVPARGSRGPTGCRMDPQMNLRAGCPRRTGEMPPPSFLACEVFHDGGCRRSRDFLRAKRPEEYALK
jgi:hypothetical protein